jgi:glycerol-3-phosphate acyltransferase PlsY
MTILTLTLWLLAYLSGSLPFGLWITRLVKRVDIRDGGSGHITTTNTIRQAGWLPGALVLVLDIAKGFLPVYFALRLGQPAWAVAIVATLIVAGHCWPVFAQFRGGMGLAVTGGAFLAISWQGFLIGFGILIFFVLVIRHAARGTFIASLVIPPVIWLLFSTTTILWVAIATCIVVAIRFTVDWNRKYRELWLDRETRGTDNG